MTFKEAAVKIKNDIAVSHLRDYKDSETALDMAVRLLLWMDEQPEFILEGNIVDLINNYYNEGLRDGFNRAKKVYNIKD